jgi:hypothetical protein
MVDRSLQIEVSSGCLAVMMVFWVFVAVFGHLDLCVGSNLTGSSADPFHTFSNGGKNKTHFDVFFWHEMSQQSLSSLICFDVMRLMHKCM